MIRCLGPVALILATALAVGTSTVHAQMTPRSASETYGAHIVHPGESMFDLATRYGMTVDDLARMNGLGRRSMLLPGTSLRVPLSRALNARADEPATDAAAADSDLIPRPDPGTSGGLQTAGADPSDPDRATYRIRPGDTLTNIAIRFGVTIEALKRANGLPLDGHIRAGDHLQIPNREATPPDRVPAAPVMDDQFGGETAVTYVVRAGDTLTSIADAHDTTPAALRRFNELPGDAIYGGQSLLVPAPGTGVPGTGGQQRIVVDVSEQRMYVWEGETLIWNLTISTGISGYPTRRGTFAVQSKIPMAWSSAWQLWMPRWLGIYWAGASENGIHALPIVNGQRLWGGSLGTPISYGCIVLDTFDAARLYDWAEIGTPVIIRD